MGALVIVLFTLFFLSPEVMAAEKLHPDVKVGDVIEFGTYEQDNIKSNGKEAIEWEVLDCYDGQALLISKYILDSQAYNFEFSVVDWENSSLRAWLNTEFYDTAFSTADKQSVLNTKLVNADNPDYATEGGSKTTDNVFLLSYTDVLTYYDSDRRTADENRMVSVTTYAASNGAAYVTEDLYHEQYSSQNEKCIGCGYWWLRTPGEIGELAIAVYPFGIVETAGIGVTDDTMGVRPAIWVSLPKPTPQINKSKVTTYPGKKVTLNIDNLEKDAVIKWTSSDKKIAKVNSKGTVTVVSTGKVKITATVNGVKYTCVITVKNPYLNYKKIELQVGETANLKINGTSAKKFTSSKKSVATVNAKGYIVAKKPGTTTIKVVGANDKVYSCVVTVTKNKEYSAKEIYDLCKDSVVQVNAGTALGSGFFLDYYTVVTNYHVIDDATSLSVSLMDGSEYPVVEILGYSEDYDIAVLKVTNKGVPLKKNTHGITMGEAVYTIGSSLGFTNTFTDGIITNVSRIIDGVDYLQTNTAITHGNSGGPLINAYGEVIGITSGGFEKGQNLNIAINLKQLDLIDLSNPLKVEDYLLKSNTKKDMSSDYYKEFRQKMSKWLIANGELYNGNYYFDYNSKGMTYSAVYDVEEDYIYFSTINESGDYIYYHSFNYPSNQRPYASLSIYSAYDKYGDPIVYLNFTPDLNSYTEDTNIVIDEYYGTTYLKAASINLLKASFNNIISWIDWFFERNNVGLTIENMGLTSFK